MSEGFKNSEFCAGEGAAQGEEPAAASSRRSGGVDGMVDGLVGDMQKAIAAGKLNAKLGEAGEGLSNEERASLLSEFMGLRPLDGEPTLKYRVCRGVARAVAALATSLINRSTPMDGLENLRGIEGGAIVTSNHFSPVDSTMFRKAARSVGRSHVAVVSSEENLAMGGLFGFIIKYADSLPISPDRSYMRDYFEPMLKRELDSGNFVIIYPEQEMWFNYAKPRTCKRGAYLYAARFGVPVIPCFVELHGREGLTRSNYLQVSYALHILEPLYPDPALTERQNSIEMAQRDYEQKVAAYEKAAGRTLDYTFEAGDVAGWVPKTEKRTSQPRAAKGCADEAGAPGRVEQAFAYYQALPREGRLPGKCEMRLPEGLEGKRVVDLLCRSGKGAFKLAERVGPGGFVLACDPDESRVREAEQRRAEAEAVGEGWARRLAFRCGVPEDLRACGAEDASFDLVYANAAVNASFDFEAVLAEAFRALAPGGVLWVAGVFAAEDADGADGGASDGGEAAEGAGVGEGLAQAGAACDPALRGNVFACAPTFARMEAAAARAGFASCEFADVRAIVPDGADAAPELAGRSFVSADARLVKPAL